MSKWLIPALTFIVGLMIGATVVARTTGRSGTEDIDKENALSSQIAALQGQVRAAAASLKESEDQTQACQAKFQRTTVLYDGILIKGPRWVIPADVEPTLVGPRQQADYTHVDPKTQLETIHMQPKISQ